MTSQQEDPDKTGNTSETLNVVTSSSPEPTAFAAKARDLQALRDAVVDAAGVGGGLWLSYLFVFFYLAVAVGRVTHRDLFFEYPGQAAVSKR
jgi:hypothetical protein